MQKDKIFNENLILQWQTEKMAKKWQNFTKWPNVFFHGQCSYKMAIFFKIGYEMANPATL